MTHKEQVRLCGEWARRYAEMGYNPLPSRYDAKRPALGSYRRWLTEPVPMDWLRRWRWPNVQVVCGARWKLAVVDIDGVESLDYWSRAVLAGGDLSSGGLSPWMSSSPSLADGVEDFAGRVHVWFSLPEGFVSCPTTLLWARDVHLKGHPEVKLIGDGGLVVAPPSVHPERKTAYRWLDEERSPIGPPAMMPGWLLEKVSESRRPHSPPPAPPIVERRRRPSGMGYTTQEVLAGLGDEKLTIAQGHGLRVVLVGERWVECRAVDREDRNPSCSFDRFTGRYFDWTLNESCSFFDLLCRLDPAMFPDWSTARDRLGVMYLGVLPCPRQPRTSNLTSS